MRQIDKTNITAKAPEGIGYHSAKKYFKLNPNKKTETNIYSKDYKKVSSKANALKKLINKNK